MKPIYVLAMAIALFLSACGENNGEGNKTKKHKAKENGEQYVGDDQGNGVQYVYKNWLVVREVPMKNRAAHGVWKEYYDDRKLKLEIDYNSGKKEGKSTEYYDTGEKYIETPYSDNKTNGVRYRYKKDGTIVSEAPYEKGIAVPGIKEYDADGEIVEQPTVVFTRKGGNLEMKMSNNAKSAEFYQLANDEILKAPAENGVGKLALGNAKKGSLKIRAVYKTAYGNMAAVDTVY